jgi:glyoxylase-like metal-dependent hydrolase (beta-lactamase superfamily II)
MSRWEFSKGLHEIGQGCWAWLQPDGSWGFSNAGLVTDGEASLLVDTLFDLKLTGEMLDAMRDAAAAARDIDTVVNTHANGDHCYGNALVKDATILASKACAEEMQELPASALAALFQAAPQLGAAGEFLQKIFGRFEFEGIESVLPNRTFEGELSWKVGNKELRLMEVGPAHTKGDVLVHCVSDRVVFTGDILFIEGTPIIWEGPVDNWIRACERIEGMDVDVVVPGHGPITNRDGARQVREYLAFVRDEARARYDAGISAADACREIAGELGRFGSWTDRERIVVNVDTLYREFAGSVERTAITELFGRMAELAG